MENTDYLVGSWHVTPKLNQIRRNGDTITLQNLSMQVLHYLAERPGQVIAYDEFLDKLWPNRVVGEDAVHRRIADLRRQLGDSSKARKYIQTIPKRGYVLVAPVSIASKPAQFLWRRPAIIAATLSIFIVPFILLRGDPGASGGDNDISRLAVSIESSPPNATVHYRPYGETGDWEPLGVTPLDAEIPEGTAQIRFVADGHRSQVLVAPNPSTVFNNVDRPFYTVKLAKSSEVPADMVFVPGGNSIIPLFGFYRSADLGDFYIGKTEVSNREFAQFMDADGYATQEFWSDLGEIDFVDAISRFSDSTGQPGPSTWRNGTYPEGTADHPVGGVSWYEAMAYARFRGMTLPTARHWARAALGVEENNWPLAPDLLAAANLDSVGTVPASDINAISTWGAVNLVGNVREWVTTTEGNARLSLGLSFNGPQWAYAFPGSSLPRQRNAEQGFRLAYMPGGAGDPELNLGANVPKVPVVSDDEYAEIRELFNYEPGSVTAAMATLISSKQEQEWVRDTYLIESDTIHEPLPVLVFRPAASTLPLQPVIFLPPGDSYNGKFPSEQIDIERYNIDFVVKSGRALVWPIIAGTHERFKPRPSSNNGKIGERWLRAKKVRRAEIGAVIDFLDDHAEYNGSQVSLLAASFGATMVSSNIIATESRIKTVVLLSASLAAVNPDVFPNGVNPNTFWPRVTTPILVLNGQYDIANHITESRDLLLKTIGTSSELKKGVLYESSHWPLPQHRVRADTLQWLDRYVGAVD